MSQIKLNRKQRRKYVLIKTANSTDRSIDAEDVIESCLIKEWREFEDSLWSRIGVQYRDYFRGIGDTEEIAKRVIEVWPSDPNARS